MCVAHLPLRSEFICHYFTASYVQLARQLDKHFSKLVKPEAPDTHLSDAFKTCNRSSTRLTSSRKLERRKHVPTDQHNAPIL